MLEILPPADINATCLKDVTLHCSSVIPDTICINTNSTPSAIQSDNSVQTFHASFETRCGSVGKDLRAHNYILLLVHNLYSYVQFSDQFKDHPGAF